MNAVQRFMEFFRRSDCAVSLEERRYREKIANRQTALAERLGGLERLHFVDELRRHIHREDE